MLPCVLKFCIYLFVWPYVLIAAVMVDVNRVIKAVQGVSTTLTQSIRKVLRFPPPPLKQTRIAFLHPVFRKSEDDKAVLNFALALQEDLQVVVITNEFKLAYDLEDLEGHSLEVHEIGRWLGVIHRRLPFLTLFYFDEIRIFYVTVIYTIFYLWKVDADVFVVDQSTFILIFLRIFNRKVIHYCRNPHYDKDVGLSTFRRILRRSRVKLMNLANAVILSHEYSSRVLYGFGNVNTLCHVVYPTISRRLKRYHQSGVILGGISDVISNLRRTGDEVVFLSHCYDDEHFQLHLLHESLKCLRRLLSEKDYSRIVLVVLMDRNCREKSYYKGVISGKLERVYFLEDCSEDVRIQLMFQSDCLVSVPKRPFFDVAVLEAIAAGKPVIACNFEGPAIAILNEISGYECKPEPKCIARSMALILDRERSAQLGLKAKKLAKDFFSSEVFCGEIKTIVRNILK